MTEYNKMEKVVSLQITDKTKLTQQAIAFADGANNSFVQTHTLFADDKETDVIMFVFGNIGGKNTKRTFLVKDKEFDNVKDAFEAAGYEWLKNENVTGDTK
jgi:hypothetical protein